MNAAPGAARDEPAAHVVVFCTAPPSFDVESLARTLVSSKLAACVQVLPSIRSIYSWQGEVQQEAETLLLMKTRADLFDSLRSAIVAAHPYDVPEVVAVRVAAAHAPYLAWIDSVTTRTDG